MGEEKRKGTYAPPFAGRGEKKADNSLPYPNKSFSNLLRWKLLNVNLALVRLETSEIFNLFASLVDFFK